MIRLLMRGVRVGSAQAGGVQVGSPSMVAGPAAGGEVVVVVAAEQGQVVEVGRSAVDPGDDVVAFAPSGGWSQPGKEQPPSRAIRA